MKKFVLLLLLVGCLNAQTVDKNVGNTLADGATAMSANPALTPVSLAISPAPCTVLVNTDCGYTATLTLSNAQTFDVTHYASWSTSLPSIAQVCTPPQCPNASVQHYFCVSAGSSLISAQYGTFLQSTSQICNPNVPPAPTVVSILVAPAAPTISVGTTQSFQVTATMSDGTSQDVTSQVTWTVGTPTVAQLTGSVPPVLCKAAGSSLVTATLGSFTNSATITCNATLTSINVTPATANVLIGASPTFKATCTFSDGSSSDCTLLTTWTSTDNTIAKPVTPTANPEPYSALKAGTVTVTAAIGAVNGTSTLTITNPGPPPPTLASIALTPANKTLNINGTQDMVATCTFSDGSTTNCTSTAIWSSATPATVQLQFPDGIVGTPYTAAATTCSSAPCTWTVPSTTAPGGSVHDVVDIMTMPLPDRNNFHMSQTGLYKAYVVQPGLVQWVKSSSGHPWDFEMFDANSVYQWCTEGPTFGNSSGYKCYPRPPAIWPRYFVDGTDIVKLAPGPNVYNTTENCGADNLQPIDNLDIKGEFTGPFTDVNFGGSIPNAQPYYLADKFIKGTSGVYTTRERYWLVPPYGQVQWSTAHWNGSTYITDQTTLQNNRVAGGAPVPVFTCKIPTPPITANLPPGQLSTSTTTLGMVDSTGAVSGTPSVVGSYPFTIQQEDSGGVFHLQPQTIRVVTSAAQAQQTVRCLVAGGPIAVTAHIGAVTNNTNVTCQALVPTIVSIAVTPANQTVVNGSSLSYKATATMSDGTTQDVTSTVVWSVVSSAIAQVVGTANPQPVKCLATGTTAVRAVQGVTGTTNIICTPPTPPVAGNDTYETVGDVCHFGTNDSYALLPTTCMYTNPSAFPSPGTLRIATTAAQVTADIAAMACGDITRIDAGVSGQFLLPNLHCDSTHYWAIKGFGMASLPAYGSRVTPCFAGIASLPGYVHNDGSSVYNCGSTSMNMPAITSTKGVGTGAVFRVPPGGTDYGVIEGLFFTRTPGGLVTDVAIDTSTGGTWSHILFYKNIVAGTVGDDTNRAMALNRCNFCAVIDNFMYELHCVSVTGACSDAKGVGDGTNNHAGDTDHAHKIVNNFIASAAQCLLSGGAAAQLTPGDLEWRNNYCFKPPAWNPACTVLLCGIAYNGGTGGHPYIVKNGLELKNAQRVLMEGNYLENNWAGFSQVGNAITLTPKNQSGTLCPLCFTINVTVRYNWIRSYAQIFQIANVSDGGGTYAVAGNAYSLHDDLGEHMQYAACYQCQASASMMTMFNGIQATDILHNVDVNHNTDVISSDTTTAFYSGYTLGADAAVSPNNNVNMKWQNSIWPIGRFGGIQSSSGSGQSCASGKSDAVGIINACWTVGPFTGNTFVPRVIANAGATNPVWPAGTCVITGTGVAGYTALFMNYNNGKDGDYRVNPNHPCHSTGNDGKDPGPDIPTLLNRIQATTVQ